MKTTRELIQDYSKLNAQVLSLEEQIGALTIEKKRLQAEMDEIEDVLKADMIDAGMRRAVIAGWKINISNSTSTVIEAEDELPDEFWRIERKPDLMKVKESIKLGMPVPGAILITRQNINLKPAQQL